MPKKINENKLKISGTACLDKPPKGLNVFCDLTFKNATITGDRDIRDNEDETEDIIYKLKITPETEIHILAENDILRARKKGSQSQKLRACLREFFDQQHAGDYENFELFYAEQMGNIIKYIKNKLL